MTVLLERVGHVGVVTIDRPEKRNAIDTETANELSGRLDELESDIDLWSAS